MNKHKSWFLVSKLNRNSMASVRPDVSFPTCGEETKLREIDHKVERRKLFTCDNEINTSNSDDIFIRNFIS